MNISDVINDIKLSLGLNTIALPYNSPIENVVKEILAISVRTFSQFKKHEKDGYELITNLRYMNDYERSQNIFFLPGDLTTTHVHEAFATVASSASHRGEINNNLFTSGAPFIGFGSYYPQDILNATAVGAAVNKFTGITSKVPTSKWKGFNKIQLFDFPANTLVHFVVKCDHDLSCETIPDSCRESFMLLATLDVQRSLYNNLKNMTNVGGAFKEIQLKIDDWANAESARRELVTKWEDSFYLDDPDLVQFF